MSSQSSSKPVALSRRKIFWTEDTPRPIEKTKKAKNIKILPAGKVAGIYHYGTYESVERSYRKLLDFCREHELEILSDSYEFCINDYFSSGDEREFITEIFFYVK